MSKTLLTDEELKAIDDEYLHDGLMSLKGYVRRLLAHSAALTSQLKAKDEALRAARKAVLEEMRPEFEAAYLAVNGQGTDRAKRYADRRIIALLQKATP